MVIGTPPRVAVIGAGIIGTMAAWQLATRGIDVQVFEQWNTPNDRGASAGESRIFRTIYREGSEYVPLLQQSKILWQQLQHRQKTQLLEPCGALTIGHSDHHDVTAVLDCATTTRLQHRVLDTQELAQHYPQFRIEPDEIGVYDPAAGILRPELAVRAARNESQQLGVTYHRYTRVLNVRPLRSGLMVDTYQGAQHFDNVVVASGPWANELSGFTSDIVGPRRIIGLWFPPHDTTLHEPDNMPICLRRSASGTLSCTPAIDDGGVKILPNFLGWPHLAHVTDLPRFVEPDVIQATEHAVGQLFPGLDPTAIRVSTWAEGFAKDEAPLVGPSPKDERIIVAVGMSGQGFKFAPMIGSIIADVVTTGASADAIPLMNSTRFA